MKKIAGAFLDAVEELPPSEGTRKSAEEWRDQLLRRKKNMPAAARPAGWRGGVRGNAECAGWDDGAGGGAVVYGPGDGGDWGAGTGRRSTGRRVDQCAAAGARLVALSALLLVLGGSWALQLRKSEGINAERRSGDMVFDSSIAADVV